MLYSLKFSIFILNIETLAKSYLLYYYNPTIENIYVLFQITNKCIISLFEFISNLSFQLNNFDNGYKNLNESILLKLDFPKKVLKTNNFHNLLSSYNVLTTFADNPVSIIKIILLHEKTWERLFQTNKFAKQVTMTNCIHKVLLNEIGPKLNRLQQIYELRYYNSILRKLEEKSNSDVITHVKSFIV